MIRGKLCTNNCETSQVISRKNRTWIYHVLLTATHICRKQPASFKQLLEGLADLVRPIARSQCLIISRSQSSTQQDNRHMCSPYHDASLNVNHLSINSSGSTASFVSFTLTLQRVRRASFVPCKNNKKAVFRSESWEKNRSCALSFGSFGLEVLSTFFKILTTSDNLLWRKIFDFLQAWYRQMLKMEQIQPPFDLRTRNSK